MIRRAGVGDAAALARLHAAIAAGSPDRSWGDTEIAALIADPAVTVLMSDHAFVIWRLAAGEAEILFIGTHPDFRAKGEARAILDHCILALKGNAAIELFLEVRESNEKAISLYRSRDFQMVGLRKGYYCSNMAQKEDALIFKLMLQHP